MSIRKLRTPLTALLGVVMLCAIASAGLHMWNNENGSVVLGDGTTVGTFETSNNGDTLSIHVNDPASDKTYTWNPTTQRYEGPGGYFVITNHVDTAPSHYDYLWYGTGAPGEFRNLIG